MNKLNFLNLIANAVFFLVMASSNISAANSSAVFNPNATEFRGKVVVAKTFATWCRYCRQGAVKELELKKVNSSPFEKVEDDITKIILVPADNFQESVQFFEDLGDMPEIRVISDKQMSNWNVVYFPTILIFNDTKLVKTFAGEIELEAVVKAIQTIKITN